MDPQRWKQVDRLLQSALDVAECERDTFLHRECEGDESLEREIKSLLSAHREAENFLETPAAGGEYRFAPGLELGPYVIETRLGAGGMGEVYRAKDKRLHRTVALKVLPERLARTPGLRQRLEREAKAISSLNHPRICTLYDVGREGEVDYLVMEFLEGDTLAQRLKRGALPLPEVLEFAIQIASGLAAAHVAGIVHRDLKPGNIMLTKSGAKLLDFGLAKAAKAVAAAAISNQSEPITMAGTVVGTMQYMSPEQIHGHEADARSDLFAFGATLYEMLTGKRAFAGESQLEMLNAILEKDPVPVRDLQPLMPPALERVVTRCLAKDPENRWQNTSDLASELTWISETKGTPVTAADGGPVPKGQRRELLNGALAVIFLLAAIIGAVSYWRLARTPASAITAEITPPGKVRFDTDHFGGEVALSPDGRAVAFGAVDAGGKTMLWIRSLNSLTARPLSGTEGAHHPFWSADSRALGFFTDSELKSIDAEGGPAIVMAGSRLAEAGGSWNRDGTILFVPDFGKGVYQVAGAGRSPFPVITADRKEATFFTFAHPRFLPDGKHFLYAYGSLDPAVGGTYFASLDGRENRLVVGGNTFAKYASGFLLYVREGTLFAQAFDPDRGRLKGDQPHRVAEGVGRSVGFIRNSFDVSENGILVYRTSSEVNGKRLTWFDRTGKIQGVAGEAGDYWDVRLSPDGQKLASNTGSPNSEIWVDDLTRTVRMRLTNDPETDQGDPVWSPDSNRIAFAITDKVHGSIYLKYSNGAGGSQELLLSGDSDTYVWPSSWSRDGRFILYSRDAGAGPVTASRRVIDIWILPMEGSRSPRLFMQGYTRAYDGQFSPDGRWVAYTSEESGRGEVYVVPFEANRTLNTGHASASTGGGDRWQVSANGGHSPRWRRDGKEIYYLSQTNQMMAAGVEQKGHGMVVRAAQALFNCMPGVSIPVSSPYDVSPDGKKFVINSLNDDTPLILLVNWTANLK